MSHHYYEPLIYAEDLRYSLRRERLIAGFDLNVEEQLRLLTRLKFGGELDTIPIAQGEPVGRADG